MRAPLGSLCLICAWVVQLSAQGATPPSPDTPPAKRRTTPEVYHPTLEQFTPPGLIQLEFGSPLSASGYRKLRAALAWAPRSERADYYFDAYDGTQFLLRTGDAPLKVRIKRKKSGPEWQVSRFVAKDTVMVGALTIKLHTTESWTTRLDTVHANSLIAGSDAFTGHLAAGGRALRADADRVDSAWKRLRAEAPPVGAAVIDHLLAGHRYRFYPRKVTPDKVRLGAALPGFTSPGVVLMLGTEPEVDVNGRAVTAYELEAEAGGEVTPAQARDIAVAIGRLMQRAGITVRDQQEVPTMSNEYTLRQLARAGSAPAPLP